MISQLINNPAEFLLRIPIILIALSVHESAHAFVAYKLGDPTARNFGRITLNPVKHFDIIGGLCMLLFGFGWAKPVPVNSRNFREPKRDMALTSFAGPVSNLILGFIGILLYHITFSVIMAVGVASSSFGYNIQLLLLQFFVVFASLNIGLAIFNLLPVPPLDGSRLAFLFLPDRLYFKIMQYERYIYIAMIILMATGVLTTPLSYIARFIYRGFDFIVGLLPFI